MKALLILPTHRFFTILLLLAAIGAIDLLPDDAIATPSIVAVAPPEGFTSFLTPKMSADGSTVVGYSRTFVAGIEYRRAYLWTRADGVRSFGELGSDAPDQAAFEPKAISGDGSRIAGFSDAGAVVWDRGIGTTVLPYLMPGTNIAGISGISDDGRYVVGSAHDGGTWTEVVQSPSGGYLAIEQPRRVPVRWDLDAGTVVALSPERGTAFDVSDTGVVVGHLQPQIPGVANPVAAFRWDETRGSQLVPSGSADYSLGFNGDVQAISADGTTIVGRNLDEPPPSVPLPLVQRAYFWNGSPGSGAVLPSEGLTMLDAPIPDSYEVNAQATGVSADGSTIIGNYVGTVSRTSTFIWTRETGFQDLVVLFRTLGIPMDGWTILSATGVSADGQTILGMGRFRDAQGRSSVVSWVAVIPEPSTVLLMGLGLAGLAAHGVRRC